MGLRLKTGLLVMVLLAPLVGLLLWIQGSTRAEAGAYAIAGEMRERFDEDWVARCESRPRFGRRRRRFHVYGEDFSPRVRSDLALVASLREQLEQGEETAWRRVGPGESQNGLEVVTRVAASGPCAYVGVRRRLPPPAPIWPILMVVMLAGLVAALASAPLVRRVRKLTKAIDEAGDSDALSQVDSSRDELGDLSRAFSRDRATLRGKVQEIAEQKQTLQTFLANTTHDVMTPLTALVGHLSSLRNLHDEDSRQEVQGAIEETEYMRSLLRNLGAAARLDGALDLVAEPVALEPLVERVVARFDALAKERGVEVNSAVDTGASLRADLTLLEQAIGNLVGNAIRYNRPGGHVALVVSVDGGQVEIRCADDGPGVSDADLARLGERRFRSKEARSRRPTGSGFGLSIVSDVCDRFGLTLRFAHSEGGGLTATITGP